MINKPAGSMPDETNEHTERLQVVLSRFGGVSRRGAAEIIRSGRVRVDGAPAVEPGLRVVAGSSRIEVDGGLLSTGIPPRLRTIMLYKPSGLICSASEEQGSTVYECLRGIDERLVPVGRLDKDSEGLLLLSNDGELINELTHPRFGHEKEYFVEVRGYFNEWRLDVLRGPITFENGVRYEAPVAVDLLESEAGYTPLRHRLRIVLAEGQNRQVRRMCESVGLRVERLVRVAIDDLRLPDDLAPREWRDLSERDFRSLRLKGGSGRG